ncbi:MAG: hypothetical protein N3B18_01925 [Desulfobacterota bacterium]|nr:hypothetical protein [Thermodesulfobacteriota bacterium]
MMIAPVSSISWYAPHSISAYIGLHSSLSGAQMLYRTLSSMNRPCIAALSPSFDYTTKAFFLAYGGRPSCAAAAPWAAAGIGTQLDIIA